MVDWWGLRPSWLRPVRRVVWERRRREFERSEAYRRERRRYEEIRAEFLMFYG